VSFLQKLLFGEDVLPPSVDYHIKRQRRKTLALHILNDARVEVRAPKWVSKRDIESFVQERTSWALQEQQKALQKLASQARYLDGECHYYLGQQYLLSVTEAGRASTHFQDSIFTVKVRNPDDEAQVKAALERWYRRQGEAFFAQRLAICYQRLPIETLDFRPLPNLSLRKMRNRWGSCSSKGAITLNSLLMKMPVECIDYVIVHELCHLWEFNHSKAFYQLMSRLMPEWKRHKALLEELA
jgi:predicted metal-dependent hydrolase